jgi:ketosteroid isomerase-like protein
MSQADDQQPHDPMSHLKRMRTFSWIAAIAFLASTVPALAQTASAASQPTPRVETASVQDVAERLLHALDNLDWEAFREGWASEPTVFFPFGDTPDRVTGKEAVEARWRRFFDETRSSTPGPPYLHLKPLDIQTRRYGEVGVVTFALELTLGGRPLPLQRRTLVFVREHDAWKLAHMHASGASAR